MAETFVICDKYIEFNGMVFWVFRRRLLQKFCFLYFREVSVLLRETSLERFIITLSSILSWIFLDSLSYVFFKEKCLLKTSVNKFRKWWCFMLFKLHLKMSLSSSALKLYLFGSSDRAYELSPWYCSSKFVKFGKSCFENVRTRPIHEWFQDF